MNPESIDFLHEYCDFSNPNNVWILKAIARNKDNVSNHEKFMRRMILKSADDIIPCCQELENNLPQDDRVYRIYVSLNARDVVKTTFSFQKTLIDIGMGLAFGRPDALEMSKKVSSLWKTELEQNGNRGTKRVLLDVDNDCGEKTGWIRVYIEREILAQSYGVQLVTCRKTVNGYHIVLSACDTRGILAYCKEIGAEVELHKDSMVYVETIGSVEEIS